MFGVKPRFGISKATKFAVTIGLFSLGAVFGWFGREQFVGVPAPQQPSKDNLAAAPTLLRDINTETPRQEAPDVAVVKFDVLPPISLGASAETDSEPSDDEVIAALEESLGIKPDKSDRRDATIVTKKVLDYVGAPRVYPIIGPAQLHRIGYKCRVSYPVSPRIDFDSPRASDNGVELVVYIDRDNYHRIEDRDTVDKPSQSQDDSSIQPPEVDHGHLAVPSDDEVLRALKVVSATGKEWPFPREVKRDKVRIVKELVEEEVDELRVYPLIGPAQLHHVHYKCSVTCTKTTRFFGPIDVDRASYVCVLGRQIAKQLNSDDTIEVVTREIQTSIWFRRHDFYHAKAT